jgi:HD-like signal output (HDOD) protein
MALVMLVCENERETQVLKLAFEQKDIKVLCSKPDYRNYVKILQYLPDIILIELPKIAHTQLHFADMLKAHKKTKFIPIISYGDKVDDAMKKAFVDKGIYYYINRPLKFSTILDVVGKNLKLTDKQLFLPKTQPSDIEKDIELLLNNQTLGEKKIEVMARHVVKLMAFPFTVAKVLRLADSETSAAADLARVIQADPVISVQILKISNSVIFASVNRRIGSVRDAIIRVGFKETRRLVISMAVMQLFGKKSNNAGLDRKAFWLHSLVCGVISERLARQMGTVNTEEAFLAGILHDFGILLFDEYFPTVFSRLLEDTTNKNTQFILSERAMLGITHNDVIRDLFSHWKLPASVTEGIVGQYLFSTFQNNLDTPGKKIALCVGLGDILAKTLGIGKECDRDITPVPNWVFESVRMSAGFTDGFLDYINHQIMLYREFLKLDAKEFGGSVEEKEVAEKTPIGVINHARDTFVPPFLYLRSEGYEVVPLALDAQKGPNGSVREVVLWAGEKITDDIVAQALKIAQGSQSRPETRTNENRASLFVFIDDGCSALTQKNELTDVKFFKKSFDLRQLDVLS